VLQQLPERRRVVRACVQMDASTRARVHDPWEWWNAFRVLCDSQAALGVVIDIGASLPAEDDWRRWIGEPLRRAPPLAACASCSF